MEIFYLPQVTKFIENFKNNEQISGKITRMLSLLEKDAPYLRPPESKQVDHNLFELRIKTKIQIRIFYTFHLNTVFVLHGYTKKTQRIEPYIVDYNITYKLYYYYLMKTNSNEKIIKYLNENHPGWSRWEDIKKNMLSDPKTKEVYDALEPEFALKALLLEARAKKGMTQKKLAEKLGTKQSAIARFESGKTNPTFDFINKLAIALGAKIKIIIE